MFKKSIALIVLIVFIFSLISAVEVSANNIDFKIINEQWGKLDADTIKHIPRQLSVKRFLDNIKAAQGVAKGIYAEDGVTEVTDGNIRDGLILKLTQGETTAEYKLFLSLYIDYYMMHSAGPLNMTFPQEGQPAPDFPCTGFLVIEGTATFTSYEDTIISIAYYNPTDYAFALRFKDGIVTQFGGNNLGDRVKYELNKPTHYVVIMDLDNSRALTYLNGVAVSNDTVKGDAVGHLGKKRPFDLVQVPRRIAKGFCMYTIPTMQDFDITGYQTSLTSGNSGVVIDNDNRIVKIIDESIVTKRDLFKCFTFKNKEEQDRVTLVDVADGEIVDNSIELRPRHLVNVKSSNGKVNSQYEIQSVNNEKIYRLNESDSKKAGLLKAIGILDKNEAVIDLATVSRGEFAKYLARMVDCTDAGNPNTELFIDVKKGNKLLPYVNAVAEQGYMSGRGDATFGANSKITYNEALAAIVRAAGYKNMADAKGGWPGGYLVTANNIKLTKGIQAGGEEKLSRLACARLLYNALMLSYNDAAGITEDSIIYSASPDNTLLNKFHDVVMGEGRVTANKFTGLHSTDAKTYKGFINIDDKQFEISEGAGYESLLGMNTEFFYNKNDGPPYKIVYMCKAQEVKSVTVKADKIDSITDTEIKYFNEKDAILSQRLADGFSFIYNGRLDTGRTREDLLISDGELTLIDSQGTGKCDVVIAREAEFYEFDAMNEKRNMIFAIDDSGNFQNIELIDDFYSITMINSLGEKSAISLKDIKREAVLTVYRSFDGECVEIEVSDITKKGMIDYKTEDEIGINSTSYKLASTISREEVDALRLDTIYTFKLNSLGDIAFISDGENAYNYGYLIGGEGGEGLSFKNSKLRVVVGAEEYKEFPIADKIRVNGTKYDRKEALTKSPIISDGRILKTLIKYKLDEKDSINNIITVSKSEGEDINNAIYMNISASGLIMLDGRVVLDSSTFIMSVPIESEREDYLCYKEPEFKQEEGKNVTIFDFDSENRTCGAVLAYATEAISGDEYLTMRGEKGVINKVRMARTDDGEQLQQIEVMTNSELKTYLISDEFIDKELDIRFGDVVRFTMNKDGNIQNIVREFRINPDGTNPDMTPHCNQDYYIFRRGPVIDKGSNYIVINDEEKQKEVILPLKGKVEYIVDFENKTITPAKVNDFIPNIHYLYEHSPGQYAPNIMVGYYF